MAEQLMQVPAGIASRDRPQPERLPRFLDKMGALMAKDYGWSAEIRQLKTPVMPEFADHDAVSTRHTLRFLMTSLKANCETIVRPNRRATLSEQ